MSLAAYAAFRITKQLETISSISNVYHKFFPVTIAGVLIPIQFCLLIVTTFDECQQIVQNTIDNTDTGICIPAGFHSFLLQIELLIVNIWNLYGYHASDLQNWGIIPGLEDNKRSNLQFLPFSPRFVNTIIPYLVSLCFVFGCVLRVMLCCETLAHCTAPKQENSQCYVVCPLECNFCFLQFV